MQRVESCHSDGVRSDSLTINPFVQAGRFGFLGIAAAWQLSLMLALWGEAGRLKSRLLEEASPGDWGDAPAWDGTFYLPLLFLAPFCWSFCCGLEWSSIGSFSGLLTKKSTRCSAAFLSVFVFTLSLCSSWFASTQKMTSGHSVAPVSIVLPLVQDELSYQLQARGILEGRWTWPGPEVAPELFHQMHVLNNGRWGSRYLPGTGLWLAPWEAVGAPVWGQRCAGALGAAGIFLLGNQLGGLFVGLVAGCLVAVSPAQVIFNNLLLSHSPTFAGLVLFLNCMLRVMKGSHWLDALFAGAGLAFAMLCRPLTAAAVGLPWGIWFGVVATRSILNKQSASCESRRWLSCAIAMGVPLLMGFALIALQNQSLTGNFWRTGYQEYTRLHTPRHAFGFHQAQPSTPVEPDKVLQDYDQWADDLDVELAARNAFQRLHGSLAWSAGLIPLVMSGTIFGLTLPWQTRGAQFVLASIASLHCAHVPYWLDGMLGHHYVLESGPLWILLFAIVSRQLLEFSVIRNCLLFCLWWCLLVGCVVGMNHVPIGQRGESRLAAGWHPFLKSTSGYRDFQNELCQTSIQEPALILVSPSKGDRHAQFVRNQPPFDAKILVGMERSDLYSIEAITVLFPHRNIYRYDSASRSFTQLRSLPGETTE